MAKRMAILFLLVTVTGCSSTFYKYPNQIRLAVYQRGCLDVQDASTADGARVQYYACGEGKRSQEWQITPAQSVAQVQIMNMNSQKCMAVADDPTTGGVNTPGEPVVQEICQPIGSAPAQLWRIVPATDGTPGDQIINAASGECLDLPYGAIASIFLMQQFTCTPGDPAQGWTVNPVQLGNIP
jgi:hypothetical protein